MRVIDKIDLANINLSDIATLPVNSIIYESTDQSMNMTNVFKRKQICIFAFGEHEDFLIA